MSACRPTPAVAPPGGASGPETAWRHGPTGGRLGPSGAGRARLCPPAADGSGTPPPCGGGKHRNLLHPPSSRNGPNETSDPPYVRLASLAFSRSAVAKTGVPWYNSDVLRAQLPQLESDMPNSSRGGAIRYRTKERGNQPSGANFAGLPAWVIGRECSGRGSLAPARQLTPSATRGPVVRAALSLVVHAHPSRSCAWRT